MRPEDRGRWAAALAAARKRWLTGRPAERVRVQDELDALWAELEGHDATSSVGPKHSALGALVHPGRGVTEGKPNH